MDVAYKFLGSSEPFFHFLLAVIIYRRNIFRLYPIVRSDIADLGTVDCVKVRLAGTKHNFFKSTRHDLCESFLKRWPMEQIQNKN